MKISIVTPSYNQGDFIEETIRSVLSQACDCEIEYWIMDGGSSDQTMDICRKYEGRLHFVSEPDKGQVDALNKGFSRATGDILGWLNSDDLYEEGAISRVVESFRREKFKWCFGNCRNIDENGRQIRKFVTRYKNYNSRRYSRKILLTKDFIPQPAVFISRSAFEKVGLLNPDYDYAMDYDYWLRLAGHFPPLYINRYLASFRWHRMSKSKNNYRKAAWEAYRIAEKHSNGEDRPYIYRHLIHVMIVWIIYSILP